MSDNTNAAPAGASEQITAPTQDTGPMDRSTAVDVLAGLDQAPEAPAAAAPEGTATQETIEAPTEDATGETPAAEAEGDDAATEEAAAADNTETKADDEEPEVVIHGNAMLVLRDGTKVRASDARKAIGELREYHAKVPDLAATAQRIREREAQLAQHEQESTTALNNAYNIVNAFLPPEPNPALIETDILGYTEQEKRREYVMRYLQQIQDSAQAQHQQSMQKAEAAREAEQNAFIAQSRKVLAEKIPGTDSPEGRDKFYQGIAKIAEPYGISADEVHKTVHPGLLHMVHDLAKDAAAYRQLMKQKETAQAKTAAAPPVQQPGRRVSAEQSATRAADEQLKQWRDSGHSRAGAAAILGNLD